MGRKDKAKRSLIERNGYRVSPSSLDSDAVMILDASRNFIDLYYPETPVVRRQLIKDFDWRKQ